MSQSILLERLCECHGIATEYTDVWGRRHEVAEETNPLTPHRLAWYAQQSRAVPAQTVTWKALSLRKQHPELLDYVPSKAGLRSCACRSQLFLQAFRLRC